MKNQNEIKEVVEIVEIEMTQEKNKESKPDRKIKISLDKKTIIISAIIIGAGLLVSLAYYYKSLVIAATVNGSPISRFAVISELEKSSGKTVLNSLINQKLINSEAKNKNMTVSNEEINDQIKTIESQLTTQGQTLDEVLSSQNMTKDYLIEQITTQKLLEKLLADKTQVTDEEVDQYFKDNKTAIPAGQEEDYKAQAKTELEQQKFSDEASKLIEDLQSKASIRHFVNY